MFNAHRRDLLGFNDYMDLKKPGFGGPASAIQARDAKGKLINKSPKLSQYRRVVERDPAFSHKVYDSTYKAMTHDLVYKQEGKKPFTYPDPYFTAYPTVEVGELDENTKVVSFNTFINEGYDDISSVTANLRSFEGGSEEFGMNPNDYRSSCCKSSIDEDAYCDNCGKDDSVEYGMHCGMNPDQYGMNPDQYGNGMTPDNYGMNPDDYRSSCCKSSIDEDAYCDNCGKDDSVEYGMHCGMNPDQYGMNPDGDSCSRCGETVDEYNFCSNCDNDESDFGANPEFSDDPANLLGLSKEEMDKFLADLQK